MFRKRNYKISNLMCTIKQKNCNRVDIRTNSYDICDLIRVGVPKTFCYVPHL